MAAKSWMGWLSLALSAAPAVAQFDRVAIHGYGGWAAGYSDANPYLAGSGDGEPNWQNLEVVLLVEAQPVDRLRIVFAPEFEVEEDEEESKIELLYAEWRMTDAVRFQAGRGRLAFGLYADIYDVGTLRPFYYLPQSIYGHTGFVAEFYDGLGLVGRSQKGDWSLQWNAYVGGATLDIDEPFEEVLEPEGGGEVDEELEGAEAELELVAGARLLLETPVEGLTVGFSALAGQPEEAGDFAEDDDTTFGDFVSYALALEYSRGPWTLRSELGRHEETEFDTDAGYLELSYRLGEHWQLAGRWDTADADFVGELPEEFASTLEHDELSVGLNYWWNANFVLKASYHRVDGNLFAHPHGEIAGAEEPLDARTDLVVFGAQFSF
jgi:hypothetical protein